MSEENFNRNVYFNLKDEESARAWEILHSQEVKQEFKSQNKFIIKAIIDYFERQMDLKEDSYLETREKEDAFVERIVNEVQQKAFANIPALIGASVMSGQYPLLSVNPNQVVGTPTSDIVKENAMEEVSDDEPEENDLLEFGFGC